MYDNLSVRGRIVMVLIGLLMFVYCMRLFSIQILSEEYKGQAESRSIKTKIITPPRGNIYNRNTQIYVSNSPIFDLTVIPKEFHLADTSLLPQYIEMSNDQIHAQVKKAAKRSRFQEFILARHIEPKTYSILQEELWNFSGISFNMSNKRYYQYPVGGNFLGYISEVDSTIIRSSENYYEQGDMAGKSGIEKNYDETLRGGKGYSVILKDVYNREVGSYANGKMDKKASKGQDIMLGIDTDLQAFGELLMQNKKGSIVAIEPSTGEILAFVSAPSYDPNQLTGKELQKNWRTLRNDTLNPLYNRPLMATYPPGSIFKLAVALAALNEEIINPNTFYSCGGSFKRNRGKPACRMHITPLDLEEAIQFSCNSYFSAIYWDFLHNRKYEDIYEGYNTWYSYMSKLGIGQKLNVDIPYEKGGLLPSADMYDNEDRWYGKNRWQASTIISNAIGQGEILMTPLQMANLATIIANRGKYVEPHFVKAVKNLNENKDWNFKTYPTIYTDIKGKHFATVINAMEEVVSEGTARRAFISDISVCGKTGTVQNPHGEDHATFVGFAPKNKPRIAIAVIIENAGGGGRWAAPTASLMIEKYIRGDIQEKTFEYQRILDASFIQ